MLRFPIILVALLLALPYEATAQGTVEEVTYQAGDRAIHGTLTLPVGPGRHPAILFIQGSGPTDRN